MREIMPGIDPLPIKTLGEFTQIVIQQSAHPEKSLIRVSCCRWPYMTINGKTVPIHLILKSFQVLTDSLEKGFEQLTRQEASQQVACMAMSIKSLTQLKTEANAHVSRLIKLINFIIKLFKSIFVKHHSFASIIENEIRRLDILQKMMLKKAPLSLPPVPSDMTEQEQEDAPLTEANAEVVVDPFEVDTTTTVLGVEIQIVATPPASPAHSEPMSKTTGPSPAMKMPDIVLVVQSEPLLKIDHITTSPLIVKIDSSAQSPQVIERVMDTTVPKEGTCSSIVLPKIEAEPPQTPPSVAPAPVPVKVTTVVNEPVKLQQTVVNIAQPPKQVPVAKAVPAVRRPAPTLVIAPNPMAAILGHRDYSLALTKAQMDDLSFIINTLTEKNLLSLLSFANDLKIRGKRLDCKHPLVSLKAILTNPKLRENFYKLHQRSPGKIGNEFSLGFINSLRHESAIGNLLPEQIADFAKSVKISVATIEPLLMNFEWESFMKVLVTHARPPTATK